VRCSILDIPDTFAGGGSFLLDAVLTETGWTAALAEAMGNAVLLRLSRGETRTRSTLGTAGGCMACAKLGRDIFGELDRPVFCVEMAADTNTSEEHFFSCSCRVGPPILSLFPFSMRQFATYTITFQRANEY